MKNKGFTLVEMMAVIAVIGLLVVLVLPNVLKSYRDAKKVSFINEAKIVYKASTDKYVSEKTKGKKIGLIQKEADNTSNELALNEASDLNYTIRLDSEGRVTAFKLSNSEFCIVGVGDFLGTYSKEDVIELSDEEKAKACEVGKLQDNQKFILRLQNKETVKDDYNPKIIYLKYNVGWFNDNNLHNEIDSVTKPYRENYYYEGAWATNTINSSIQAISCDGSITQGPNGGGIFTGKEEKPYVEAFSKFTKKYYQVAFVGGENSSGTIETIKCDYGSSECKLPSNVDANGYGTNINKTGYLFLGWKSGSNTYTDGQSLPVLTDANEDSYPFYKFDNAKVCSGTQNVENTLTFTAEWDPIKYKVQYNCNNGSGTMASTDHVYDAEKNLRKNTCTRTGYTFLGWSRDQSATTATYSDEARVKNLTTVNNDVIALYAIWQANVYTLTLNKNSGSGGNDAIYEKYNTGWYSDSNASTLITKVTRPTRSGHAFKGYFSSTTSSTSYINSDGTITARSTDFTSSTTAYAQWTACGKGYYLNGNTCTKCPVGSYSTGDANPSCASCPSGYTTSDVGSTAKTACKIVCNPNTHVSKADGQCVACPTGYSRSKHEVTAGNTSGCYPNTFTVKYDGNGKDSGSTGSHTCTYDQECLLSINGFKKTGYDFDGWKQDNTGEILDEFDSIKNIIPSGEVTFFAQWDKPDSVVVKFYYIDKDDNRYKIGWTKKNRNVEIGSTSVTTAGWYMNTTCTAHQGTVIDGGLYNLPVMGKDKYKFIGWYTKKKYGEGVQVFDEDGNLNKSVSGYSNKKGEWTRTTSTKLYAHYQQFDFDTTGCQQY